LGRQARRLVAFVHEEYGARAGESSSGSGRGTLPVGSVGMGMVTAGASGNPQG
jgi:hypothetical protein